jgi:hypothetical protein
LAAALLAQGQPAYSPPVTDTETTTTTTQRHSAHAKHFFKTKDLVGADVKDSQGEKLGDITELYLNPQTGAALATIDIDGPRDAVVPLQGLTVTRPAGALRNAEVTLNKSQADLKAGPTIGSNEWQKLDDETFTRQIYSHYNLQEPSAMGGSDLKNESSTGSGTSLKR